MSNQISTEILDVNGIRVFKAQVDDIPIIYMEPGIAVNERKLAIFLNGLGGTKESLVPYLKDISDRGYVALAFDKYQHGERGKPHENIVDRVFSNMRRYGWVVLGQTVLDTERIIDWAVDTLGVVPEIYMGGISMGGDIAISVAGIDSRLVSIAPITTTPDWMRPGMHEISDPSRLMNPGKPDAYSQFFYDQLNPITNLKRYIDCPSMYVTQGREDTHIPPENMERFKFELANLSPQAAQRIKIVYVPGPKADHGDVFRRKDEWWEEMLNGWLGKI